MDNPAKKPIIGILGGIASGKSTVAAEFARLGCKVIDADKIAKELLDEPHIKEKIVSVFGGCILGSAGGIDHNKLAAIVFSDADKLSTLNSVVHPAVLVRARRLMQQYEGQEQVRAIVLDMPLLVEVGWTERCDKLVFVDCEPQLRAIRAKKIGIFDGNQLRMRENFQISLDRKAGLADNTVDNNSGLSELARQVAEIFSYIMSEE
ncbi:MAG: dephospho-CoA kinase [Planctomycetota bacterium]